MSTNRRLLVVDDDRAMREMLASLFREEGYVVSEAASADAALELRAPSTTSTSCSRTSSMPGKSGVELVGELRELRPGHAGRADDRVRQRSTRPSTRCARAPSTTLTKPFEPDDVIRTVEARARAARASRTRTAAARARSTAAAARRADRRERGDARSLRADPARRAHDASSVLITGESGTGKEVVARALHFHGRPRAEAVRPDQLHGDPGGPARERAVRPRARRLHRRARDASAACSSSADGGTLFLDEIGDMGSGLQGKLLRVLQDREVRPVGSTQSVKVDVRIIAATNRDLDAEIAAGRFREDLFYRLNVIPIHMPPLRERPDDIPALVEGVPAPAQRRARAALLAAEAIERLVAHPLARQRARARERGRARARALRRRPAQRRRPAARQRLRRADPEPRGATSGGGLVQALADAARNASRCAQLEDLYIEQMLAVTGGKKGEAARDARHRPQDALPPRPDPLT